MDETLYKSISPNKLPKVWFNYYVVYQYNWSSTFIVGLNSEIEAHALQLDLLTHKNIVRCELFGHYPVNLLESL